MGKKVLIFYKSVTGFTKEYAEIIARETGGTLMDLQKAAAGIITGYDIVVFGGRMHAGTVDGLKRAKKLFTQSGAPQFIVYTTGAMPCEASGTIDAMWRNNLSPSELITIPHFYMPSGLRYEKMPWIDKWTMKAFCAMMKKKKDKNDYERQAEQIIDHSFDISSPSYAIPLIDTIKNG